MRGTTVAVVDAGAVSERTSAESGETVRRVPRASWAALLLITLLLAGAGLAAWEIRMRSLGLTTADVGDTNDHWAAARRALAEGPADQVAIVGDSRIWFDTDLAVWKELTGTSPIQLGLEGTNGRYILKDLAEDERFRGLAVVGLTEALFFAMPPGLRGNAPEYWRTQSYSQRFGHQIHLRLSRRLAFLDQQYTPQKLFRWLDLPNRAGVMPPARTPWKISEAFDHRQTFLWPRVIEDTALRDSTRATWIGMVTFVLPPLTDEVAHVVIDDAVRDVRRIRARGGEVVFIRPPSAGGFLAEERQRMPRARTWDRLIEATGAVGVHWEDYDEMQNLEAPEWSHLTRESAKRFTHAYVSVLLRDVPWLRARSDEWRNQPR